MKEKIIIPINEFFEFLIEFDVSINILAGGDSGQIDVYFNKEIPTSHKYYSIHSNIADQLQGIFDRYLFESFDIPVNGNVSSSGTIGIILTEDNDYCFHFNLEITDNEDQDTLHEVNITDFVLNNHIESLQYSYYYGDKSDEDINIFLPICIDLNGENPELNESYNEYITNQEHDLTLTLNEIIDNEIESNIDRDHLDYLQYYIYIDNYRNDPNVTLDTLDIVYLQRSSLTNENHIILIEEIFNKKNDGDELVIYNEDEKITHLIF